MGLCKLEENSHYSNGKHRKNAAFRHSALCGNGDMARRDFKTFVDCVDHVEGYENGKCAEGGGNTDHGDFCDSVKPGTLGLREQRAESTNCGDCEICVNWLC